MRRSLLLAGCLAAACMSESGAQETGTGFEPPESGPACELYRQQLTDPGSSGRAQLVQIGLSCSMAFRLDVSSEVERYHQLMSLPPSSGLRFAITPSGHRFVHLLWEGPDAWRLESRLYGADGSLEQPHSAPLPLTTDSPNDFYFRAVTDELIYLSAGDHELHSFSIDTLELIDSWDFGSEWTSMRVSPEGRWVRLSAGNASSDDLLVEGLYSLESATLLATELNPNTDGSSRWLAPGVLLSSDNSSITLREAPDFDPKRVGPPVEGAEFGSISIDWPRRRLSYELKLGPGAQQLWLGELKKDNASSDWNIEPVRRITEFNDGRAVWADDGRLYFMSESKIQGFENMLAPMQTLDSGELTQIYIHSPIVVSPDGRWAYTERSESLYDDVEPHFDVWDLGDPGSPPSDAHIIFEVLGYNDMFWVGQ